MAIGLNDNIEVLAPKPSDPRNLTETNELYASVAAANLAIPITRRCLRLPVNLVDGEYWYRDGVEDGDLVLKTIDISGKEDKANKGVADGYVPLNTGATIDYQYLPDAILGQLTYGGNFNATDQEALLSNNAKTKLGTTLDTITLTNDATDITGFVDNEGIYYITSVDGAFAGINFEAGDWLISTGSAWQKVDNTDAVTSVNGHSGNVSLSLQDVLDAGNVSTKGLEIYTTNETAVYAFSSANIAFVVDSQEGVGLLSNSNKKTSAVFNIGSLNNNNITEFQKNGINQASISHDGIVNANGADFSGNVGIGVVVPYISLDVLGEFGLGGVGEGVDESLLGTKGLVFASNYSENKFTFPSSSITNKLNNLFGGNILFSTREFWGSDLKERMRITDNGNVGIGVINPTEKLHVDGSISATNYTGSANLTEISTAPTAPNGTNTNQIATTAFVLANAGSSGNGNSITNLSTTQTSTIVTINSDTGTDATITLANGTNAGVSTNDYTTAEKNKLSNISTNNVSTNRLPKANSSGGFDNSVLIEVNGNLGIGSATVPGEMFHLGDGNMLLEGGGEVAQKFKRDFSTTGENLGVPTGSGVSVNPIFQIGRIIQAGDGDPEIRFMYSDDYAYERTVFEVDRKGIAASVKTAIGSHFEGFASLTDVNPMFRLNSYPRMRLEMGAGGNNITDVAVERGANGELHFFTNSINRGGFDVNGNLNLLNVPTAPTAPIGTNTNQIATTAFVIANTGGSARPYKVYTALISQSGTSAPTVVVLENTLNELPIWTYNAIGDYRCTTVTEQFLPNLTAVFCTKDAVAVDEVAFKGSRVNYETVKFTTTNASGGTNSQLNNSTIEIRVYNPAE